MDIYNWFDGTEKSADLLKFEKEQILPSINAGFWPVASRQLTTKSTIDPALGTHKPSTRITSLSKSTSDILARRLIFTPR